MSLFRKHIVSGVDFKKFMETAEPQLVAQAIMDAECVEHCISLFVIASLAHNIYKAHLTNNDQRIIDIKREIKSITDDMNGEGQVFFTIAMEEPEYLAEKVSFRVGREIYEKITTAVSPITTLEQ